MKELIVPAGGPPPVGPYSPAVKAGGWVFVSGQIPILGNGDLVGGPIKVQVRQVLENLSTLLAAAGTSLDKVVKASVFLRDLGDFEEMNEVYDEYFGASKPARSTVQVSRLPKDVDVEIDVIALA